MTTSHEAFHPALGKHGDLCTGFGLDARPIEARARNHDPQHEPYGIVWHARETASSSAASSGVATQRTDNQPSTAPTRPNQPSSLQRDLANASAASSSVATEHAGAERQSQEPDERKQLSSLHQPTLPAPQKTEKQPAAHAGYALPLLPEEVASANQPNQQTHT